MAQELANLALLLELVEFLPKLTLVGTTMGERLQAIKSSLRVNPIGIELREKVIHPLTQPICLFAMLKRNKLLSSGTIKLRKLKNSD